MAEIELNLTENEVVKIVQHLAKGFSEESYSYAAHIEGCSHGEAFEALGRAMFNEYCIKAVKAVLEDYDNADRA